MGFMQKLLLCLKTNSRDKFLRLVPYDCICDSTPCSSYLPVSDISCDNSLKENGKNNTS